MRAETQRALDKGSARERLSGDEALALFELLTPGGLFALERAAFRHRSARHSRVVTFVSNVQINPSNLCEGSCRFCRYAAKEGDEHAYSMTEEEILERIRDAQAEEVHVVGGMNSVWPFERSRDLISLVRRRWPGIHIKAFTAVEVDYFAREAGISTLAVLDALKAAGVDALPGGGAENFSHRIRRRHCPDKLSPEGWLDIHREAHGLGMTTNATMLYGLDETPGERVDHLLALRELQDATGGFSCFIPLPYQPGADAARLAGPSPVLDLGIVAVSRLVLDNFDHIKAYWPMMGLETAAAAFSFGADDLDGTIGEERIAHAAGATTPKAVSRERMVDTIRSGGFEPVERDGRFHPIVRGSNRRRHV